MKNCPLLRRSAIVLNILIMPMPVDQQQLCLEPSDFIHAFLSFPGLHPQSFFFQRMVVPLLPSSKPSHQQVLIPKGTCRYAVRVMATATTTSGAAATAATGTRSQAQRPSLAKLLKCLGLGTATVVWLEAGQGFPGSR